MVHSVCLVPPAYGVMMKPILFTLIVAFSAQLAVAQGPTTLLSPRTTLPINFDRGIDSKHVHVGDAISAKTTQPVHLSNGQTHSCKDPESRGM